MHNVSDEHIVCCCVVFYEFVIGLLKRYSPSIALTTALCWRPCQISNSSSNFVDS